MTTPIEYALMAGAAYISNRALINQFAVPQGWLEFAHVPNNPDYPNFTSASGFEAVSFQNQTNPNEIVISFAGTDGNGGSLLTNADKQADLALGLGLWSAQLGEAADYYLERTAGVRSCLLPTPHLFKTHLGQVLH